MSTASFKCVFVSLSELFPRARLVVPPRLLGAALARGLVVLPAVVGRSACGCNAQHPPLLTACASKRHSPLPSQCAAAALLAVRALTRPLFLLSAFAPVAEAAASPSPSLIVPACCSIRMAVLSVFPRRHLRACLSRLAVARGAQLRTSLLLLLALRDAARRPRRLLSAAPLRLASVAPPVEPVAGASLRGRRTGSEAVSGSPRARCAVASAVRCLRGVRVVCRSCVAATPLCVINARRARETRGAWHCLATEHCDPRPSGASEGRAKSTGASAARSLFGSRRTAVRASAPTEAVGIGNRQPPRQAGHAREAALRRRLTPATPNAPRTARGSAQLARGNGHCRTPAWLRPGEGGQAVASRAVSTGALCESRHARTRRSSAWSAPGAHSGERAARLGTAAWALATPARNRRGQRHAPR
ncbi:hypothetical protein ERJ75_001159000 [Trypanosoma vivax]|nr:hypothetical protein ERJ75_001159000 [Trypanosoma vivax]